MNQGSDKSNRKEMDAIKRAAAEKTGLDHFGDPYFEGPLSAWIRDLRGPDISDFGRTFMHRLVTRDLERRLKVLAYLDAHPEILQVEIPPILYITGHPRTGSTLLHHLMATHPLSRSFQRWELMEPLPPPTWETYTVDPRIAKVQSSIEPLRGSPLERLHWVNADEPEENAWAFIDCTGLLGCGVRPLMRAWSQWLSENDLAPTFRSFRKMVQLLIWKCPPPQGGHLVLKCVMTTLKVRAFADAFPEANFILVHRDPFRALISGCVTGDAICRPFTQDQAGPLEEGGRAGQWAFIGLKAVLSALVDFAKVYRARVKNVLYSELMRDAVSTTRSVYAHFNVPIPGDLEDRILNYLKAQRRENRAAPPKRYETYGYDADAVWADHAVSEYCSFFGVEREERRLVDTRTGS